MHPNAALIEQFYRAFGALDAETMAKCYHADVIFSDPAFGELRGSRARDMWRMLAKRAKDLRIEASNIQADDKTGSARWVATYTFAKTRRKVRNVIHARFEFKDGLILRHDDSFSFPKWASMALGPVGTLLGWTPWLQNKVRKEALRGLDEFVGKKAKA